ncbi:MAG: DNA mismatch endonuclease Vsr [Caldilinea sp.]
MAMRKDNLSVEDRLRTMRSVRSQDTKPEMLVRRSVFGLGYRYRLHRKDLPGKPDLVFVKRRKVIFVHGCFWHGHHCKAGMKQPKTNVDYWTAKLQRNRARDLLHYQQLSELGWRHLVLWECELKDTLSLEKKIVAFLEESVHDGSV